MIFVKEISVYHVKGGRRSETPLEWVRVDEGGVWGNRWWVIVDEKGRMVNQKTVPRMCLISSCLTGGTLCVDFGLTPHAERVYVSVGDEHRDEVLVDFRGTKLTGFKESIAVCRELSRFLEGNYRLVQLCGPRPAKTGNALRRGDDSHPFLFISEASLAQLNTRLNTPVRMDAFRPTIVLGGCDAYEEDHLDSFQIGQVQFEGQTLCTRCHVPGIEQGTGKERVHDVGEHPFDALQLYRGTPKGPVFGRNANHTSLGII